MTDHDSLCLELPLPSVRRLALCVKFVWLGDRFTHQIVLRSPLGDCPLIRSVEPQAQSMVPACPPVQQAAVEPRGPDQVLLGVGQAGSSHWSTSIASRRSPVELEFDIACRCDLTLDALGSRYQLLAGPMVPGNSAEPRKLTPPMEVPTPIQRLVLWESGTVGEAEDGSAPIRVVIEPMAGSQMTWIGQNGEQSIVAVSPIGQQENAGRRTVRWSYRIAAIA